MLWTLYCYIIKESSASTPICIVPSRYKLTYSSGSSMASAFNAQSDPEVVVKKIIHKREVIFLRQMLGIAITVDCYSRSGQEYFIEK